MQSNADKSKYIPRYLLEALANMYKANVMTRMDTPTAVHRTGENGNHSDIHDGNILGLGTRHVTPEVE
jgi:hypothetical protein